MVLGLRLFLESFGFSFRVLLRVLGIRFRVLGLGFWFRVLGVGFGRFSF